MDQQLGQSELLPLVREKVRDALTRSQAFRALTPEQRKEIAGNTVKAFHYILGGADGQSRPEAVTLGGNASGFAPTEALAGVSPSVRAVTPRPQIGNAARAGGDALSNLISEVNFPAFVSGLVDGVFNSIVSSSIKQMEAYAELVKNVSKTVDQYMKDNVSEDNARDYLTQKYPDHLEMDFTAEKPKLKPKEGADDANLPDFFSDLGLKMPITSLDEDNVESQLMPAARQRIAMDRQQMLATMVMMGVNRLVVTNGSIEASCLFKLDTHDNRTRSHTGTYGSESERNYNADWGSDYNAQWSGERQDNERIKNAKYSGDYKWYSKGHYDDRAKFTVSTVDTNKSEEDIKLHAELTGKVKLNFKSDYFPMERMIDALQINQIKEKTAAAQPAPNPQPNLPPPPPPPPIPQVPGMPGTAPGTTTR